MAAYHPFAIILALVVLAAIPVKSQNSTTSTLTTGSTTGSPTFPYITVSSLPNTYSGDTNTANYITFTGCQVTKKGIVYAVTGTGNVLQATTCPQYGGSYSFDTYIYVSDLYQCITQNDNYCSSGSRVTWSSVAGARYYVFVSGYSSYTGAYAVAFSSIGPTFSYIPVNYLPYSDSKDTTYGNSISLTACSTGTKYGYVYSLVGTGGNIVVSMCATDGGTSVFDSYIYVTDLVNCVTSNDDYCGSASRVSFFSSIGITYYIFITGYNSNVGRYTVAIFGYSSQPIPRFPYYVSNNTNLAPTINFAPCVASKKGYVYSVVGNGATIVASVCTADGGYFNYDTMIYVTDSSTCVVQNDDYCNYGSRVSWYSTYGRTYYIFVTGYTTNTGSYTLAVLSSGGNVNTTTGTMTLTSSTGSSSSCSGLSCRDCMYSGCTWCTDGNSGGNVQYCSSYAYCYIPLYTCPSNGSDGPNLYYLFLIIPGIGVIVVFIYSCMRCRNARRPPRTVVRPPPPVVRQLPYPAPRPYAPPPPYGEQTPLIANNIPVVPPPAKDVSGDEAKELLLCAICSVHDKSVSLGCGHLLCEACVRQVRACPFCKKEITTMHRIFF